MNHNSTNGLFLEWNNTLGGSGNVPYKAKSKSKAVQYQRSKSSHRQGTAKSAPLARLTLRVLSLPYSQPKLKSPLFVATWPGPAWPAVENKAMHAGRRAAEEDAEGGAARKEGSGGNPEQIGTLGQTQGAVYHHCIRYTE